MASISFCDSGRRGFKSLHSPSDLSSRKERRAALSLYLSLSSLKQLKSWRPVVSAPGPTAIGQAWPSLRSSVADRPVNLSARHDDWCAEKQRPSLERRDQVSSELCKVVTGRIQAENGPQKRKKATAKPTPSDAQCWEDAQELVRLALVVVGRRDCAGAYRERFLASSRRGEHRCCLLGSSTCDP